MSHINRRITRAHSLTGWHMVNMTVAAAAPQERDQRMWSFRGGISRAIDEAALSCS